MCFSPSQDSIIGNLLDFRAPTVNMVFMNIRVRRDHILEDSMKEVVKMK